MRPAIAMLVFRLALASAWADEPPAGMVTALSGSTSPSLAAMAEIPSGSPLQLSAGTELTFLHYAKCKLITLSGGSLTLTRTEFTTDGKMLGFTAPSGRAERHVDIDQLEADAHIERHVGRSGRAGRPVDRIPRSRSRRVRRSKAGRAVCSRLGGHAPR